MFKNKKCFYEHNLDNDKEKFGISHITKENYVSRANSYQSTCVDYVKFKNILIIPNEYYEKIENLFSDFVKHNSLGKRLNHIRKKCEIYNIYSKNIMEEFYNIIKDNIKECQLLSYEEVNILNENYKKSLQYQRQEESGKDKLLKNIITEEFFEDDILDLNMDIGEEEEEDLSEIQSEEKFKFYDYQQRTINNYNGETGILSYTMGLGKTITCQGLIDKMRTIGKIKNGDIIFWATRSKDILKTQMEDFNIFKDLFDFKIISMISIKRKDIKYKINQCSNDKLNIILINTASIKKLNKITPSLCIFDECHGITGGDIYEVLSNLKNKQIPIIGLSATPMKMGDEKSYDRINNLFGKVDGHGIGTDWPA